MLLTMDIQTVGRVQAKFSHNLAYRGRNSQPIPVKSLNLRPYLPPDIDNGTVEQV